MKKENKSIRKKKNDMVKNTKKKYRRKGPGRGCQKSKKNSTKKGEKNG